MSENIKHFGTKRHSGRYPWGSGNNSYQSNKTFLDLMQELRDSGFSEVERAKAVGLDSTTDLRSYISLANAKVRKEDYARAIRLKEKGYSATKAAELMGLPNESSYRSLLKPSIQKRSEITMNTAQMLKDQIAERKYIDIGVGVEHHLGVTRNKLKNAVAALEKEGYTKHYIYTEQAGSGKNTSVMVLAAPGVEWKEVNKNRNEISVINNYTRDGGKTWDDIKPPKNIDSKRIAIRYDEDGGRERDGLIELRRGVDDVSLGHSKYAQVRIAVDGEYYLKGMAMYSDDLPKGVDIRFNTNKSKEKGKLGVMKEMEKLQNGKVDQDNPFGATIRQRNYIDKNGKKQLSALNIVNEEGDWADWSRNLSSQMLSKQPPTLAKRQLDKAYERRQKEYDEIMQLTNPTVKRKLLETFSDGAEAASVHLKAAAMPRQATNVILPFSEIKDTEVYAPNFREGENVVLIRYPHGGRFEIPQLKVNNKYKTAIKAIGNARDAIGINSKVAERLSGADFDGDNVLVIPNDKGQVKISSALTNLKSFDPSASYPAYKGMPKVKKSTKEQEMGNVSNLITDMTIKGASQSEIARAVRHSMVVIDSEKHQLDYKKSYEDNSIAALKKNYQGSARSGASTIISRASSVKYVDPRKMKIDPKTGKKIYEYEKDNTYVNSKGKVVRRKIKSKKMLEVEDANELSSGMPIESIYATHANKLKALTNKGRKEALAIKDIPYSKQARITYQEQADSLAAKVRLAERNAPLERKATILANEQVKAKIKERPDMTYADIKRKKGQAITAARKKVGAKKPKVDITDKEWEAIQAGAISKTALKKVVDNADLDRVRALATPISKRVMTPDKVARANTYLKRGHTRAEVADKLGVSISTLDRATN